MCICKKNKNYSEILGDWEERGVIGSRVEIDESKVTVLWRGGVVLETPYTVKEEDGSLLLVLAKNGMRYEGSASDYATVTELRYKDEKLTFAELFPISGPSTSVLSKTDNNRFGNYDYADGMLEKLKGKWKDENGYNELVFSGDTLSINGEKLKVRVLKPRWQGGDDYIIRNADPAKGLPNGLEQLWIKNGELIGSILVCDAGPLYFRFHKV